MSTLHKLSNLEMEVKRTCTGCPICGLKVKCHNVNRAVDGQFSPGYIESIRVWWSRSWPVFRNFVNGFHVILRTSIGLALCSTWFTNICPDEVLPKYMTLTSRRKNRMKCLSNVCPSIICLQLHYARIL